jgi:hypothetical protein
MGADEQPAGFPEQGLHGFRQSGRENGGIGETEPMIAPEVGEA